MLFHENIETILVFVVRFYYVVALLKSMVGWEGLSYNEIKKVEAKENHSWDNQYNFFTINITSLRINFSRAFY